MCESRYLELVRAMTVPVVSYCHGLVHSGKHLFTVWYTVENTFSRFGTQWKTSFHDLVQCGKHLFHDLVLCGKHLFHDLVQCGKHLFTI